MSSDDDDISRAEASVDGRPGDGRELKRGWTTGTCASAATRAAFEALVTDNLPEIVEVTLPGGGHPTFAVASCERLGSGDSAVGRASVVKDAGDDPDVTHGALVVASVRRGATGTGITYSAGEGVGTVTKPGLAISPGEPAINPVPRKMIAEAVRVVCEKFDTPGDVKVEISIPGGAELAEKTLNRRLGIVGGLSILGTTGIVVPYSCSAWIHSIHRGIDVARAIGLRHVAGSTGSMSEEAIKSYHALPNEALIEMGDFAGGLLKYVQRHPVAHVTIAGGFAKMAKLAQGLLDLHSKRGSVDFNWLADRLRELGAPSDFVSFARQANTAQHVLIRAREQEIPIGDIIARDAWETAAKALRGAQIKLDVVVFDRNGSLVGKTAPAHVQFGLPR